MMMLCVKIRSISIITVKDVDYCWLIDVWHLDQNLKQLIYWKIQHLKIKGVYKNPYQIIQY